MVSAVDSRRDGFSRAAEIDAAIAGESRADKVVATIHAGTASPGALHKAFMDAWGLWGNPGLVAFCRRIEKTLERSSGG